MLSTSKFVSYIDTTAPPSLQSLAVRKLADDDLFVSAFDTNFPSSLVLLARREYYRRLGIWIQNIVETISVFSIYWKDSGVTYEDWASHEYAPILEKSRIYQIENPRLDIHRLVLFRIWEEEKIRVHARAYFTLSRMLFRLFDRSENKRLLHNFFVCFKMVDACFYGEKQEEHRYMSADLQRRTINSHPAAVEEFRCLFEREFDDEYAAVMLRLFFVDRECETELGYPYPELHKRYYIDDDGPNTFDPENIFYEDVEGNGHNLLGYFVDHVGDEVINFMIIAARKEAEQTPGLSARLDAFIAFFSYVTVVEIQSQDITPLKAKLLPYYDALDFFVKTMYQYVRDWREGQESESEIEFYRFQNFIQWPEIYITPFFHTSYPE